MVSMRTAARTMPSLWLNSLRASLYSGNVALHRTHAARVSHRPACVIYIYMHLHALYRTLVRRAGRPHGQRMPGNM